ncbi:hypothetical protein PMIN06_006067 [Paraphaeosphaeria minitans]
MASGAFGSYPVLFGTGLACGLLSLGHTVKGLEQFKHPSTNQLPPQLRGASQIGWYEGSVWFLIAGVMNYKWSQTGLVDLADKTAASLLITLLFGAGASYWRVKDKPSAGVLLAVGVLQAIGARQAS